MLNSDLLMLNDLYYPLKENLYTSSGKAKFLYQKRLRTLHLPNNVCYSCQKTIADTRNSFKKILGLTLATLTGKEDLNKNF